VTNVQRLLAIEDIKTLKAKYFYYLDHKDWERWRSEVFADDATLHVPIARAKPLVGADSIVRWVKSNARGRSSVHHGHMPIITIHSLRYAEAIWAMEDCLYWAGDSPTAEGRSYLHGFGHYHETYVHTSVGWRIKSVRLSRLHVEYG
jgi:hypothetical protein